MTTENIEASEQRFSAAISDFFGITEGGEIKAGAFAAIASKVYTAILAIIKACDEHKITEVNAFSITSGGVGITFDLLAGTIEVFMDSRDRSGATPQYYAKPDIHLFKLFAKGFVTGAAEVVVGKKLKPAGKVIEKFGKEMSISVALSWITGLAFDKFFGSQLVTIDFTKDEHSSEVLERKYLVQDDLKGALNSYWGDIHSDMKSLERVIINTDDTGKGKNIVYYRIKPKDSDDFKKSLRFDNDIEEHKIEVLKRVDEREVYRLIIGGEYSAKKILVANYLANYASNANSVKGDLTSSIGYSDTSADLEIKENQIQAAARYCLKELKGYALEGSDEKKEYTDLTIYSDEHMNARLDFFNHYLHKMIDKNYNSYTYYEDTKTGKQVGEVASGGIGLGGTYNAMNIFVDRSYNISQGDKYNRKFNVFGYSNNDDINVNIEDNVYVEGGLGSDTIKTGSGNDTIYTNANIADNFDDETSDTTNTVNSGAGNDTIYGSNGIDEINAQDGDDWLYGKKGDDILDGGKGTNHIFGGAGSDTISAESGENYIYTHTDSETGEDLDTESDTNTVNIKNGTTSSIKGGKGKDIVTIENSQHSSINIADGENIVNITGSKGYTEIITGKDKDEITISGGRKTGTNTDVNISSGAGADIIRISQSTTNRINAGDDNDADEIYGGSGYDYYFVANSDTLQDDGGLGEVWFGNRLNHLTGGTETEAGSKIYIGSGFTYQLSGNTLSVTDTLNNCGSITINDYQKYRNNGGDLKINFINLNLLVA